MFYSPLWIVLLSFLNIDFSFLNFVAYTHEHLFKASLFFLLHLLKERARIVHNILKIEFLSLWCWIFLDVIVCGWRADSCLIHIALLGIHPLKPWVIYGIWFTWLLINDRKAVPHVAIEELLLQCFSLFIQFLLVLLPQLSFLFLSLKPSNLLLC